MSTEILTTWPSWDICTTHEWKEVDSQFTNELFTDVVCVKCQCPGELDNRTGKVFFPAT
jgi:hypothetical protein